MVVLQKDYTCISNQRLIYLYYITLIQYSVFLNLNMSGIVSPSPKAKMRGIKLLIDNASSHTAKITKKLLEA